MSESLETRAGRVAESLARAADEKARSLTVRGFVVVRDVQADALAELAEIVRALVAEVSSR